MKDRYGRKNCKGFEQVFTEILRFLGEVYLDSFELEIEYACDGDDRSYVEDGMGACRDVALSSEEDEGTIFVVSGDCPGNSPAVYKEVACGNDVFLQCHGGCLRYL